MENNICYFSPLSFYLSSYEYSVPLLKSTCCDICLLCGCSITNVYTSVYRVSDSCRQTLIDTNLFLRLLRCIDSFTHDDINF